MAEGAEALVASGGGSLLRGLLSILGKPGSQVLGPAYFRLMPATVVGEILPGLVSEGRGAGAGGGPVGLGRAEALGGLEAHRAPTAFKFLLTHGLTGASEVTPVQMNVLQNADGDQGADH